MAKTLKIVLLVLIALIVGSFVFRVFAWLMWYLFLPILFGFIVIFIIVHIFSHKK